MTPNIIISLTGHELAYLGDLIGRELYGVPHSLPAIKAKMTLANKFHYLLGELSRTETFAVTVNVAEGKTMSDKTTFAEPEDDRPDWLTRATDEHAASFDPNDPITAEEVIWMFREIESGDMTPEEFLRRTS